MGDGAENVVHLLMGTEALWVVNRVVAVVEAVVVVEVVSFDAGPHSADKGGNIPAVEHGVTGIDQTADLLGETVKKSYELLLVKKDAVLFGIAHIFHCYVDALVYHAAGPVQQDLQRAGSPAVPPPGRESYPRGYA